MQRIIYYFILLSAIVLIAACSCSSHTQNKIPPSPDSAFVSGQVTEIQQGKDGYTATLVTADKQTFYATVSHSNLKAPAQYRSVTKGETIEVKGSHWKMEDQDHITVRELKAANALCYKGKLIVRGICRQRVVVLLSPNNGQLNVDPTWTNPEDGKIYKNAFAVSNVCDFPESIKLGDTFDFKPVAAKKSDCAVCMAYIPVPEKAQIIEVGCK